MVNEGKYPMSYEEYEKRVVELFLSAYPKDKREIMFGRLEKFLDEEENFINALYLDTCFDFDHPEIYGEVTKKSFEDYHLEATPVHALHQILGGSFE